MCGQRGNVLFLILIAVALFAALSYAVTKSTSGGGNANREQALLTASTITQFYTGVQVAALRMIINGKSPNDISFDVADTSDNAVFSSAGGGLSLVSVPSGLGAWGFGSLEHIDLGFYVMDVGTNTGVTGRDAIGGIVDIPLELCEAINSQLGLVGAPATNSQTTGAIPSYDVGSNVIDAYPGKRQGCFDADNGSGTYVYYHVLIEN